VPILTSRGRKPYEFALTLSEMLLYAITNRKLLKGDDAERRKRLVELAAEWARGGVDAIQIREKDLPLTELQPLAAQIVEAVRGVGGSTHVLVNGPAQVAFDAGADGVHLHSGMGVAAIQAAHQVYDRAGRDVIVSAACHSPEEIREAMGAAMMLFSPVFEKITAEGMTRGQGLVPLRAAVELSAPAKVLALGGVTEKNAAACVQAGAAGIAAIRLFLTDAWRVLREANPPAADTGRASS
jgi:thiamine-phosphate pyrophosphorylase